MFAWVLSFLYLFCVCIVLRMLCFMLCAVLISEVFMCKVQSALSQIVLVEPMLTMAVIGHGYDWRFGFFFLR